jgi:hypothetical protein
VTEQTSTERCTCGHARRDHSTRNDHEQRIPGIDLPPWCHVCHAECIYCPPEVLEAEQHETTAHVLAGLHHSAEQDVTRVINLYERWVKAGPPPLGASMARWWDIRLAELHDAIRPGEHHRSETTDPEQRLARIRDVVATFDDRGVLRIGHVNLDTPTAAEVIAAVRKELDRPQEQP